MDIEKHILSHWLHETIDNRKEIEASIIKLKELIKIQCSDGNWNSNVYMHGMANGMILALAVMENNDPKYLEWTK